MKKTLSLLLAVMMLVSVLPVAYAAEPGGNWSSGTAVEYDANDKDGDGVLDNLDYTITVPAKLAPGGSGTVTLEGMWPSNEVVKVTADASVDLVNSINASDKHTLAITFPTMEYAGNNIEAKTYTETVSVAEMPASALFGVWSGQFNYNVDIGPVQDPLNPDDGSTPADGDVYTTSDYKYTYVAADNGWKVELTAGNKASYSAICESINGEPVTNMDSTFHSCTALTAAPEIPDGVTNMNSTFYKCERLTTAPEIPDGVTNMDSTFHSCTALTAAPEIPDSVTDMSYTFNGCTSLTVAPEIPDGVTDMSYTFRGCTSLTAAPEIPASVTDMTNTFYGCSGLTGEISIPCSLASKNYKYSFCTATITYYHIDGCTGSCGQ